MVDRLKKLQGEHERWTKQHLSSDRPEPRLTEWGEPIQTLYSPLDLAGQDYLDQPGFPGEYPFARGVHPTMYLGRPWTMRQYAGYGSAQETNARFRYLLDQGQTGLSVAFDLPTQIGYDSDHPLSEGEVGKVGVPVDSLEDMELIFQDLPLDRLSTSMTINAPAAILLAMYIAVAEKQQAGPEKLRGTIQNDILKEYTVRGTYIFPPRPSIRLITDIFAFCSRQTPLFNTINVAGYHMREAGCTAVQEIAFSFANAIAYIEAGLQAGLDIDRFAPRISWIFNTSSRFFEEVAKYRAARKVWADLMRDRFKARDPRSWVLRFHTQTSGSSLTAQQAEVNLVRVAYQVLAAVLGGAQSIAACSFDEALALPTEDSVRLSLRTQQVLLHETGVTDTVDPLGGAYYLEALTRSMIGDIGLEIARIDRMGGAVAAVEQGYIQQEIERRAYQTQMEIERGERIVVGLNAFQMEEPAATALFQADPARAEEQKARLMRLKARRDAGAVGETLARVSEAARGPDNLMPPLISAVKAYATLGEICQVLRDVFGEYEPAR